MFAYSAYQCETAGAVRKNQAIAFRITWDLRPCSCYKPSCAFKPDNPSLILCSGPWNSAKRFSRFKAKQVDQGGVNAMIIYHVLDTIKHWYKLLRPNDGRRLTRTGTSLNANSVLDMSDWAQFLCGAYRWHTKITCDWWNCRLEGHRGRSESIPVLISIMHGSIASLISEKD